MPQQISQERIDALVLCDVISALSAEIERLKGNQIVAVGEEKLPEMLQRITEQNKPKEGECL